MRLVTIDAKRLNIYKKKDVEMLHDAKRPCGLIIKLKYRGRRYDFAIPLRSNIASSSPKDQYFPLPPNHTTRSKRHHGLHYIKMFPIRKSWTFPFHIDNNMYAAMMKGIIDKNEKTIISACQQYLIDYENGVHPSFSTDIDRLIDIMENS